MNYFEIRDTIKSGDIVFMKRRNGKFNFWHKLITLFTKGPFWHVGVAFWAIDKVSGIPRLYILEAYDGGRRIVNLGFYRNYELEVIESPREWTEYAEEALSRVGEVEYGYLDFIAIGLKEKFGIKLTNFKGEVCSEFVATLLNLEDDLLSPNKLYEQLKK